jgi:hypothetical protein
VTRAAQWRWMALAFYLSALFGLWACTAMNYDAWDHPQEPPAWLLTIELMCCGVLLAWAWLDDWIEPDGIYLRSVAGGRHPLPAARLL